MSEALPLADLFRDDATGIHLDEPSSYRTPPALEIVPDRAETPDELGDPTSGDDAPWRVSAGNAQELTGGPVFTTAGWLDEVDANGRSRRTAAIIASIDSEEAPRGFWGRFRSGN
ncbi:MAG: hypothetical protein ACR2GX_00005 [Candidatus Dormibacteria bacterium]